MNEMPMVRSRLAPAMPPPQATHGPVHWLRVNLLSSWSHTLLTVLALAALALVVPPLLRFALIDAVWSGADGRACATISQGGVQADGWFGACWAYVGSYFGSFLYGRYPEAELWRIHSVGLLLAAGLVPLMAGGRGRGMAVFHLVLVFPVAVYILLVGGHTRLDGFLLPLPITGWAAFWIDFLALTAALCAGAALLARNSSVRSGQAAGWMLGGMAVLACILFMVGLDFGLVPVPTERWGGLLVTMVLAGTGIAASLPLGILLALGRRSSLPLVRLFCILFIELWRGVPLITVLFMASVMLPLFLPSGFTFDNLLRALIGVSLFSAAYMAEVVRGGLQAIPRGQYEAAMALGLGYWHSMALVILPQALAKVVPGILNTFISLFKDTTLVLIIGLFDFLGMIQATFSDPRWASPVQLLSGYLFAATVYFLFCFAMSRYSNRVERRLAPGREATATRRRA